MKSKYYLILFLPFFLIANEIDKEITVTLKKTEEHPQVYISCDNLKFREILLFDLSHNGKTKGSCAKKEEERQLLEKSPFSTEFWARKEYHYVLKITIENNVIRATLFSLKTGLNSQFFCQQLTGVESSDRRVIHSLSDQVYEMITGEKGISQSQIYYAIQFRDGDKWKSEIWTADYDGKNAHQLTQENSYCINPTLFPMQGKFTKNKYLYVNYKLGQPKVYVSSFDKKQGKPFLPIRGNQLLPSLSKSGDRIAFISDAGGQADLFLQAFSPDKGLIGKPLQFYSFPFSVQASPTFRPDGKKIAFVSDQGGTPRIYLLSIPSLKNEKRATPTCLTKKYRENTCPAWSPDGTKLAYSAKINGVRQIMIYDFITQKEWQLTTGKSHKENPCWAANSMHIIFNTVDPSSSELFLINLKQKEMVKITEGSGKKHYPTWGF